MLKNTSILLFIFIFALFLRLAYLQTTIVDVPIRGDATSYVLYGFNLVTHHSYSKDPPSPSIPPRPDSYWLPGYPFFIALAMALTEGDNYYYTVLLTQAILGALTVLLIFFTSNQILPFWATLITTLLTALSPHLISMSGYILTETLFGFFLLCSLLIFYSALEKGHNGLFGLAGLFFGYTYLIKPEIFFLPFILGGLALFKQHSAEPRTLISWKHLIVFLALFSLLWGGWAVRNTLNVDSETANLTSRALVNLINGSQPDFLNNWRQQLPTEDTTHIKNLPDFWDHLTTKIQAQPAHYAHWYFLEKPYLLWSWDILIGQGDIYVYPIVKSLYTVSPAAEFSHTLMKKLHPLILVITVLGLIPLLKGNLTSLTIPVIFYITLLYLTLVYAVFFVDSRYSIPLRPELYVCALWSLTMWIDFFLKRFKTQKIEKS